MSKRALEAGLKAYPEDIIGTTRTPFDKNAPVDVNVGKRIYFMEGYKQAEKELGWHSVKESLPPIDEEVIVLTDDINGKIVSNTHKISYGHRPNPDGWDAKSIVTGKVTHYVPKTYDGWNIPGVTHWMYLPKLEEE